MRMTASWSGSNDPTAYKSVARRCAPNGELPSDPQQTDRQAAKLCKKPVSPFIIAPRAQPSRQGLRGAAWRARRGEAAGAAQAARSAFAAEVLQFALRLAGCQDARGSSGAL